LQRRPDTFQTDGTRAGALLLVFALSGCASPAYYAQAVGGQIELWRRAEPIEEVLARVKTPERLKTKLETVREIRRFASRELHLPDNRSYTKYADLKRPFVVWNVFAAEEFSVQPREWCFAIVGCVNYRGYFSREGAESYASELRAQGYDVYVGGVPAYSTLGYFDDPVLSTFIHYPETELARLIFHELAHQLVYAKGDSTFNESFASTVEEEGVRRWIAGHGGVADQASFAAAQQRKHDYLSLVEAYRGKLQLLFASEASNQEKRADKKRLFQEMKTDYQRIKAEWGGYSGYDRIFSQDLNNAFVASTSLYTQLVPAFQKLLEKNGGDLPRFYEAARRLADEPADVREAHLNELLPAGTPTRLAAPQH
jgi:predicted aminopeptidase